MKTDAKIFFSKMSAVLRALVSMWLFARLLEVLQCHNSHCPFWERKPVFHGDLASAQQIYKNGRVFQFSFPLYDIETNLNINLIIQLKVALYTFSRMCRHCFPLPSRHPLFICPVLASFPSTVQRNCLCLGPRAKLQEHWLVHFIVRINTVK